MESDNDLILYGASGHSLAVCKQIENGFTVSPLYNVVAFIDDYEGDKGKSLDGRPIISLEKWATEYEKPPIIVGMGNPLTKQKLVEKVNTFSAKFGNAYYREKSVSPDLIIGEGCIMFVPSFISSNCNIGNHVQIMPLVSIGHDVTIGDYTTICPSVTVSGFVEIGKSCFIGAGASIVNGSIDKPLVIGEGAFIGIGAVVTKPVTAGQHVFGNPAKPIRPIQPRNEDEKP